MYKSTDYVFISGKVRFNQPLPCFVMNDIDEVMRAGAKIVIGDAPGADTAVQEYLFQNDYKNVIVYATDICPRNNVGGWPVRIIPPHDGDDERTARSRKDEEMTLIADSAIVISYEEDREDSATSNNVKRLQAMRKPVVFDDYKKAVRLYK